MLTARVLSPRKESGEGRALIQVALVASWITLQGVALSDQFELLNAHGVWMLPMICAGMLAAFAGYGIARRRNATSSSKTMTDVLRLLAPPLVLSVLGAVLLLGPIMTTGSRRNYFSDPQTWLYLLNLVGVPQFSLPNVFTFNSLAGIVNQNVWAVPCIVIIAAAAALFTTRRWLRWMPVILAVLVAGVALTAQALDLDLGDVRAPLAIALRGDALTGLLGGLLGIIIYRVRGRLPWNGLTGGAVFAVLGAAALAGDGGWAGLAVVRVLLAPLIAYAGIWLSMRRRVAVRSAARLVPYLPGLLLFSFPLQQTVITMLPDQRGVTPNVILGGGAAMLLAILVWHTVGIRTLSRDQRLALAESRLSSPLGRMALRRPLPSIMREWSLWALGAIIFAGLCLGVMAMMYVAFQPDRGGI